MEVGIKLMELEVETESNRQLQQEKMRAIRDLAKEIHDEVNKIIYMVNALKKIRNVALDIILDIACSPGHSIENVVRWAICILPPHQRVGWLLSIATDFAQEINDELFAILARDAPLKATESARGKKPASISSKNYENLCKLAQYTTNLKHTCELGMKNAR